MVDDLYMRGMRVIVALVFMLFPLLVKAEYTLNYGAEFIGNTSTGEFAPYFVSSNTHGIVSQKHSSLLRLDLYHAHEKGKRFSLGYGATVIGGYSSGTNYAYYSLEASGLTERKESPAPLWLQQFYVDARYRSLFLTVGLKEDGSNLLNDRLSSGDLTMSSNFRPMPGVRAGFNEPQDIPFINGWVQIAGEIGFYKQTDSRWLENHYNYRNQFITTDAWFNYKYCYFRTKPKMPFSVTIGMQATCQFGGLMISYENGMLKSSVDMSPTAGTFMRSIFPAAGGGNVGDQNYKEGNHVGSWDVMGRYRFSNGSELKAYYQSPWEDGSSIGKLNGFDGLYGLEYKSAHETGLVTGAVVEYLDLMNQGGPIHWAPEDLPGTPLVGESTGADNYYNNYAYNGYQYYGMSIGSPVLKSPIYNTDGYMSFTDTRLRSVHFGVEGQPLSQLAYRVLFSYTKSWGTVFRPHSKPKNKTSVMVECVYELPCMPNLKFKGQLGLDRGNLFGNNFGALLSVSYNGLLKL